MILKKKDDLLFFRFKKFSGINGIVHGVFTRSGGVSKGPFKGLNTALNAEDDTGAVKKNRAIISRVLNGGTLVFARQVHGSSVIRVFEEGSRKKVYVSLPGEGDAMITCNERILLAIQTADCQSVLLYDPENRAIGNVHAGWRGSIGHIIGLTIDAMKDQFGTDPANLTAAIGPSLGPCCAEFVNYKKEIPEPLWAYKKDNRHFDFWSLSCDQLREKGVRAQHIELAKICTRCNTHLFYSYRHRKVTGRFVSVIGLT